MRQTARCLYLDGWTLRSGGASGADTAFEGGATPLGDYSRCEIYLPWREFENRVEATLHSPLHAAFTVAKWFHPNWSKLSRGARLLQARNSHQMLGADIANNPLLPKMVICWTPGGRGGGGTGQAIRIARAYRVPVYDLAIPAVRERIERYTVRRLAAA